MLKKIKKEHYIGGHWITGQGEAFSSFNPADSSTLWTGTSATEDEMLQAFDAAHKALPKWSAMTVEARAEHITAFAKQIEAKHDELTTLISLETGKPRWEAATETAAVIGKAALSVKAYHERTSSKQSPAGDSTSHLRYKPHGVVAVIGPFNFPAHLSNGHIMPALIAGNTIVYKPSELTPAVAAFILECWHDSGLPPGVLNGVQGGLNTSKAILRGNLQALYFTGSYHVGRQIHHQFAERPEIMMALEMGGNNPLLIDKVENLDAAVYNTILSSFITAGQRCTCARRVLIPDTNEGDRFLKLFIKSSMAIKVGPYTDAPEPFIGPVIRNQHALHHLKAQENLTSMGGESLLPMRLMAENTGFLSPGIIDMTDVSDAPDEEIFAPLVQIYRYSNFEHALELANQTRYGLSAGILSDSHANYQTFFNNIRAGIINWNKPTTGAGGSMPFGGIGRSGNHRPSAYFAADYCAYPIASMEKSNLTLPNELSPGIIL